MNCTYATMSKSNIMACVSNSFTFFKFTLRLNFSSVLTVSHWFFTRIALGDVDLRFSLILVTKVSAVEGGITFATWLYHQCNQSTHLTDGMTVTSLSASLQHKKSAARDHVFHITLNQKLLHKFKKWCKFSSHIWVKLYKTKLCKTRPACTHKNIPILYGICIAKLCL